MIFDKCLRFAAVVLIAGLLIGCEAGSGGGDSASPFADEPLIIDSAMTLDVVDGRPNGITNFFRSDDELIYLWTYWINVEGNHTVTVEWFAPSQGADEEPYFRKVESFTSNSEDRMIWFFINRPAGGFETGEWEVYVYFDGLFERSYIFYVE